MPGNLFWQLILVAAGKDLLAKVQAAKTLAVRTCMQFVTDKAGLDKIESIMKRVLLAGCPAP